MGSSIGVSAMPVHRCPRPDKGIPRGIDGHGFNDFPTLRLSLDAEPASPLLDRLARELDDSYPNTTT
ncbi:hypothetical protein ACWCQP_36825 [Streptomyces chartreusis]